MNGWNTHIDRLKKILESMTVTDSSAARLDPEAAMTLWKDLTHTIREKGKTIYFIGNGASASMASHISADIEKNYHVRAEVFTDLSLITAIANDMGYDEIFAEPIRRKVCTGDMLVAISSSGRSENILKAAAEAKSLGGTVVTLSAMDGGNPLRAMGDLNFHVPAATFGLAETCHAAILHYWIDLMTL
ncbi:MAG TPA: SIS domain-containing protein [bacterium]|nr:SIS domain-containing protein [bacterium]